MLVCVYKFALSIEELRFLGSARKKDMKIIRALGAQEILSCPIR